MESLLEELAAVSSWNGSSEPGQASGEHSTRTEALLKHVLSLLRGRCELAVNLQRQQAESNLLRDRLSDTEHRLQGEMNLRGQSATREAEVRGQLAALQVQLNSSHSELARAQKQAEWASNELQRHLDEFSAFRRQKSAELVRLQGLNDGLEADLSASQQRAKALDARCHEAERRLEASRTEFLNVKLELQQKTTNFMQEMDAGRRIAQVHRDTADEALRRVEELEDVLRSQEASFARLEAEKASQQENYAGLMSEKDKEAAGLLAQIDLLRQALDEALKIANQDGTFLAAEAAKEIEASGQSIAEFYAEAIKIRAGFIRAEDEVKRLRGHLNEIVKEVEAKAPLLAQTQQERDRLAQELKDLQKELLAALNARDTLEQRVLKAERSVSDAETRLQASLQESRDLSQQVQRLLMEIEGLNQAVDAGNGDFFSGKRSRLGLGNVQLTNAKEVISANLVEFGTVAELQQRNQELLRAVRSLTDKLEAVEHGAQMTSAKRIEELEHLVSSLQEIRQKQSAIIQSILQDKDLLQPVSPPNPSVANQKEIIVLEKRLEHSQHIIDRLEKDIDGYCERLAAAQKETVDLQLQASRDRSQVAVLEDRLHAVEAVKAQAIRDAETLRSQITEQAANAAQSQMQLQQLMNELISSKDSESRTKSQLDVARSEVAIASGEKHRLEQDLAQLAADKERMQALLVQLQQMLSDRDLSESQAALHLRKQLEILERDSTTVRAQLNDMVAQAASSTAANAREQRDLLQRLEAAGIAMARSQADAHQLRASLEQERARAADLEMMLRKAASEQDEGTENIQKDLQVAQLKLRALSLERDRALDKSTAAEEELSTIRTALAELQSASDAHSREMQARFDSVHSELQASLLSISDLKEQISSQQAELERIPALELEISSLTESLNGANADLNMRESILINFEEVKNELQNEKQNEQALQRQIRSLEAQLASNEAALAEINQRNQALLASIENSAGDTEDGEVIKFLRAERDRAIDSLATLKIEKAQLESKLCQLEESFAQAEQLAHGPDTLSKEEIDHLRNDSAQKSREIDQLKIKSKLLQDQLAALRAASAGGDPAPGFEEMSTLRAELSASQARLGIANEDADNWKMQFDLVQSKLNETKATYENELRQSKLQCDALKSRALALNQSLLESKLKLQDLETAKPVVSVASTVSNEPSLATTSEDSDEDSLYEDVEEDAVEDDTEDSSEPESDHGQEHEPEIRESEHGHEMDVESGDDKSMQSEPEDGASAEIATLGSNSDLLIEQPLATALTSPAAFTPAPAAQPVQSAPALPRRVVNLSGITSASSSSAISSNGNVITTASGKKFTPITAPEPKKSTASASTSIPQAANVTPEASDESASPQPKKKKKQKPLNKAPLNPLNDPVRRMKK